MKKCYKIGLVGLGSIGIRHFHNILQVLKERNTSCTIDLFRSGKGKEPDGEISRHVNKIYNSCDEVVDNYDIIFITNPTNLHFETIKHFVNNTGHMFIEKPIFDKGNIALDELKFKSSSVYYVACPLRYTGVIQYFKHNSDLSGTISVRAICSSYLPDWRPNRDYREIYSAHKDQGGGVSIDLIHEWDYICYLFGRPEKVLSIKGTFSRLEIDSEDLALYIAKYPNMTVEIHLDYFGRKTIRELQLFTDTDTIVGDIANNEIRYLNSGKTISFMEDRNNIYIKELEHFFDIVEGKADNDSDAETALSALRLAQGERYRESKE